MLLEFLFSNSGNLNPHTPDRFTPSRARCAENCGAIYTHRYRFEIDHFFAFICQNEIFQGSYVRRGLNWYSPKDAHQKSEGGQFFLQHSLLLE